ncbi:hypothetical protein ES703_73686 [subsurface metagenome]
MNLYLQIFLHTLPTLVLLAVFLVKQERRLTRLEESDIWIKKSLNNLPCIKNPDGAIHSKSIHAEV